MLYEGEGYSNGSFYGDFGREISTTMYNAFFIAIGSNNNWKRLEFAMDGGISWHFEIQFCHFDMEMHEMVF